MLAESSQVQTDPNCIDFGIGQPQLELLPTELLWQATQGVMARPNRAALNYGHPKGEGLFRRELARFLSPSYGTALDPDLLFATNGCSQALHLIANLFAEPGQTVLVEEPTYFLAHQLFRDRGLKLVGVPLLKDGVDLEALERLASKHKPALFYTVPVFQNPTGHTTSAAKRSAVVELASKHDFLVVADEVYQLLSYAQNPPPSYASFVQTERVLAVGSSSKILAPALRLGWVVAARSLQSRFLNYGLLRSGGGLNHYVSCLVGEALRSGGHQSCTEKLRREFAYRVEVMHRCLQAKLSPFLDYQKPRGGYFFWLELKDRDADATELLKVARKYGTGFRQGTRFSTEGQFGNCLRLSFAHYNENAISVGIDRLAAALKEYQTAR
jgi:2-aminoadipate transaminase